MTRARRAGEAVPVHWFLFDKKGVAMKTWWSASRSIGWVAAVLVVLVGPLGGRDARAAGSFALFESGQVRPLALSPSGDRLYAVNTPDNRLEIYAVLTGGLSHLGSVQVGLEPVAVAVRGSSEAWVVNHLSDSVSVVDVSNAARPVVKRTLLVGDEPRDIVFAGPGKSRAFITAAHRGQNIPFDPQFHTPSVGRADVWVFDANDLGNTLAGSPLTIVTLFADTPRALAVTPDGQTVYAAGFLSGNQTTIAGELLIPNELQQPPLENASGEPAPKVAVILKWIGGHWLDSIGRNWDWYVQFSLPDRDVFAIDASANPPVPRSGPGSVYASVGTVLYNMAVNPVSGKVYVSNTEARNDRRFEGPGTFFGETVRGHNSENRITVLDPQGGVTPRHLNKHIDRAACCAALPNDENARSLALPTGMVVTKNGQKLYVAALGSSKVGVYDTAALENDTFVPATASQIAVSGGGPTGLALDEKRGQLFALTRFDNAIAIIDLAAGAEVGKVTLFNPEPASVVQGRRFLYDAAHTSSSGDQACATCHVFGDFDGLSWDLGNPDDASAPNLNPFGDSFFGLPENPFFASMKGPMNTQSLRGMSNHGPMHWRGDRTGADDAPTAQPDSGAYDERAAFMKFNVAFEGLIGRSAQLTSEEMAAFTDFIVQNMYPPNPVRALDNSLSPDQAAGRDLFFNRKIFINNECQSCHVLDPPANSEFGVPVPGYFRTDGLTRLVPFSQPIKVPHFRNLYQKVGMFGLPNPEFFPGVPVFAPIPGQEGFLGEQIRGFGFSRAGDEDSVLRFVSAFAFQDFFPFAPNPEGFPQTEAGLTMRRQLADFLLAFDSNLAPIVGQQVTITHQTAGSAPARIALMAQRADHDECDLVAKGQVDGRERGYLYVGSDTYMTDVLGAALVSGASLQALGAGGVPITFTCVPPGSGVRIGIDRDADGVLDGNEP
jgi:DNA-binding beta-propeller fold protein YncE